jgi:hypothetical protein
MKRCGAAALAAVGVLALAGAAAGTRPPILRVINGGWFQVSVRGTYSMHWSANAEGMCGLSGTQFVRAQSSETVIYRTRRTVRAFVLETLIPGIGRGPRITTLVLARRFFANGSKLGANDFAPLKVATPARWTRSLSGTYQNCDEPPATLAPKGCGTFSTPFFSTWLYSVRDTRHYRGNIAMSISARAPSSLPAFRCRTDVDLPFPRYVINFLNPDLDVTLRCAPPGVILSRARTNCHAVARDNGLLPGVEETLVVSFKRSR